MKELTIEEKAERYDEAIERAKAYQGLRPEMEIIFPELKESEDERIKNEIIAFIEQSIHRGGGTPIPQEQENKWIAWLENHGEQKLIDKIQLGKKYRCIASPRYSTFIKGFIYQPEDKFLCSLMNFCSDCFEPIEDVELNPAEKVEPKFKVGDWVVIDNEVLYIKDMIDDEYITEEGGHIPFRCEKEARLWTIEDAKDGDLIYVCTEEKGILAIFHEYKNKTIFFHCYLCIDFAQGGYMPIVDVELVCPLQKTNYKRFFKKMHEAGYEWDAEKKELKKIEQKSSWTKLDNSRENVVFPFNARVKDRDKVVTIIDGQLNGNGKQWIRFSSNRDDGFKVYCPDDLLVEQKSAEWSEEDERIANALTKAANDSLLYGYIGKSKLLEWLKSIKNRVKTISRFSQ